MDRLVPTRNADAVVSYYMGLFAIIPLFGLALGSVALLKGKSGLAKVKANPEVHGKSHAMVGIGCGAIGLLFNLAIIFFVIAIFATRPK